MHFLMFYNCVYMCHHLPCSILMLLHLLTIEFHSLLWYILRFLQWILYKDCLVLLDFRWSQDFETVVPNSHRWLILIFRLVTVLKTGVLFSVSLFATKYGQPNMRGFKTKSPLKGRTKFPAPAIWRKQVVSILNLEGFSPAFITCSSHLVLLGLLL